MKRLILLAICCLAVAVVQMASGQTGGQTPDVGHQKSKADKKPAQSPRPKAKRENAAPKQPVVQPAVQPATVTPKADRKANARARAANAKAGNAKVNASPARTDQISYSDALQRCVHERHDRAWWTQRYTTIVLVGRGYYFWDAGYWFPAWGYDPAYDYYDYNGPIYTYGNLLPDQVIVNVQRALQELGYYGGKLNGSLGAPTREAIAAYQQDAGLEVTGAIDAPTVEALGLQ